MDHSSNMFAVVTVLFLAGVVSPQAYANESAKSDQHISLLGSAISDDGLASSRGRNIRETNTNNVDAMLYDNQAIANVTGSNFVTSGAFSDTNGFATVVQNSGNNVIIQNATILNLKLQ